MYSIDKQFGSLKNIATHALIYTQPDIAEFRNGESTGFLGHTVTYIQQYLKMTIHFEMPTQHANETDKAFIFRSLYETTGDLYVGTFLIQYAGRYQYLPEMFHDGWALFAKLVERPMTLSSLLSIFKLRVWIALILIILTCNFCFFVATKESPTLKNHPKFKKDIPWIVRILSFDSFISLHLEWQQGPNVSTRWLLAALNFLLFFTSTVYLIVFSVRVLSNQMELPFNIKDGLCGSTSLHVLSSLDSVSFNHRSKCGTYLAEPETKPTCVKSVGSKHLSVTQKDMFDGVRNGTVISLISIRVGTDHFKMDPHIVKSPTDFCNLPATMAIAHDFVFRDLFSQMILQLREVGILDILRKRHLTSPRKDFSSIRTMTFMETWYAFAILGMGIAVVLILLCIERITKKYRVEQSK